MQLSTLDSNRIVSILEETIEKLSVIGVVIRPINEQKEELSYAVGEEISRVILDQRRLEQRYEELVVQRSQLRAATSNKVKYKEIQQEIDEVARELRQATKNLCRNLKEAPSLMDNLKHIEQVRSNLEDTIMSSIQELQNSQNSKTLATVLDSTRKRNEMLRSTLTKEREMVQEVAKLKVELREETADRERERAQQNDEIQSLRDDLQELKAKAAIDTKYLQKGSRAHMICTRRGFSTQSTALDSDISTVQRKLEIETRCNKESVNFLESKQESLQEDIQGWISRYDQEMEEKERELENLKNNRINGLELLQETQDRMRLLEAQVIKERKRVETRRLAKEAEIKRDQAAVKIQALFRRYTTRKSLEKKKKKKKRNNSRGRSPTKSRSPSPKSLSPSPRTTNKNTNTNKSEMSSPKLSPKTNNSSRKISNGPIASSPTLNSRTSSPMGKTSDRP